MRVLVIDDDPSVRQMLELIFVLEGFEVHTSSDGTEGLSAVAAIAPDVIVLDVMMPRMDGHEVARRLHADPNHDIPIVFCSAMTAADEVWDGYRLGAASYVSKPFDPQQMVDEITRVAHPAAV